MNHHPIKPNRRLLRWWKVYGDSPPIGKSLEWNWNGKTWVKYCAVGKGLMWLQWVEATFTPPTGDEVCVYKWDYDDCYFDTGCGDTACYEDDPDFESRPFCCICGRPVALAVEKEEAP